MYIYSCICLYVYVYMYVRMHILEVVQIPTKILIMPQSHYSVYEPSKGQSYLEQNAHADVGVQTPACSVTCAERALLDISPEIIR